MLHGNDSEHRWRFFRAGGFNQVRLDSGADIAHLDELDQKLWVALACPTSGLEFDKKTLDLVDTDHDGRIRVPEIIAAAKWATGMLKTPDDLLKSSPTLEVAAINDATPEGKQLLSSAKQVLVNLGKAQATAISAEDTADTAKIFAQTKFNGDGIISPDAAEDPALQAIINDIIMCLGAETDRSGKPGISQAKLDLFFADAEAFASWHGKLGGGDGAVLPLGANTAAGAAALKAVAAKVEDYFARCRLSAFDARAAAAVNLTDGAYATVVSASMSLAGAELAGLPLAHAEPGRPLPLTEGLNPGWRHAMAMFNSQVVAPLLGDKASLTEAEWSALVAKFAPFDAWLAAKAGSSVEALGQARVQEILRYTNKSGAGAKTAIGDLIAKDKALEPEATAIAQVDQLVRYHRDLYKLLNNFVAFRDFYGRKDKAVFQAGTLYLDQRACDLCIRVEDAAKHGAMAHLSYTYLAYCDLSRKATGEKMTVACAFTGGDSDNLMTGRNGVFYDRKGKDWDATITKIVEHPISIRQAFWSPYKRLARWIQEQIAKRAAAADAASQTRLQGAATTIDTAVITPGAPLPPPLPPKKVDVGAVAAMGVAAGALGSACAYMLGWVSNVSLLVMPFYIVAVMLLISSPSMILAALKLRQRNLGPILDANGWAVNAKAKINIPFGGALTHTPKLPVGAHLDAVDPFAESHKGRNRAIAAAAVVALLTGLWYFGVAEWGMPGVLPKSSFVVVHQAKAKVDAVVAEVDADLKKGNIQQADIALSETEALRKLLPEEYVAKLDKAKATIESAKKGSGKAVESAPAKP